MLKRCPLAITIVLGVLLAVSLCSGLSWPGRPGPWPSGRERRRCRRGADMMVARQSAEQARAEQLAKQLESKSPAGQVGARRGRGTPKTAGSVCSPAIMNPNLHRRRGVTQIRPAVPPPSPWHSTRRNLP